MTSRLMAVTLGFAVIVATPAAYAQQPTELKTDAVQDSSGNPDAGFVAKMRRIADETQIVARLNGDIDGWYPRLGGMTTGSGFAFGPGYRAHVLSRRVFVDLSAAVTPKAYKAFDAKAEWLQSRYDRVELWTNFRYQDFPQEDFFGLARASSLASRTNYALESTDVTALGIFRVKPWMRVGADLGYFSPTISPGTDRNFPSIETRFSDSEAPGLTAQPNFLHTSLFAEIDNRDEPGNPSRGGYYKAAFGIWDDREREQFDLRRFDGEAAYFVPIVTKTHVIASRLGVAVVNNAPDERVPFYFFPYIGGSQTLRSVKEFRFQDENALWWNTEYRWAAFKYVGVALFFDAGKVQHGWDEMFRGELKTAYGVGFRVNTRKRVFARLDIGTGGNERRQIFFKLGPSF